MTKEKYYELVEKYGDSSSFAIWGDKSSEMDIFDESKKPWDSVQDKAIIVGINPSPHPQDVSKNMKLKNFHSDSLRHGDDRLMMALRGTELYGSFITDLSPVKTPDSSEAAKAMKKNSENDLASLLEKINDIGNVKVIVFLTTNKEFDWIKNKIPEYYKVINVPHYSRGNGHIPKMCNDCEALRDRVQGLSSKEKYALLVKHIIRERLDFFNIRF